MDVSVDGRRCLSGVHLRSFEKANRRKPGDGRRRGGFGEAQLRQSRFTTGDSRPCSEGEKADGHGTPDDIHCCTLVDFLGIFESARHWANPWCKEWWKARAGKVGARPQFLWGGAYGRLLDRS